MTVYRNLFAILVAACGACGSASVEAQTLTCPPHLPTTALRFGQADDGWSASAGEFAAPLESMGLFSGPPSEGAALQPTTANGKVVSWTLEPPYRGGLWVQCAYGGGSLTLSKPLPGIPKVCVAKYGAAHANRPRAIDFSCR